MDQKLLEVYRKMVVPLGIIRFSEIRYIFSYLIIEEISHMRYEQIRGSIDYESSLRTPKVANQTVQRSTKMLNYLKKIKENEIRFNDLPFICGISGKYSQVMN